MQEINPSQLKLEVHDTYKRDEQMTTTLEASNPQVAINRTYWDEKFLRTDSHMSLLEKDYNKVKLLSNKQSIEEVLFQGGVKTTIQILWGKKLFDIFSNAEKVSKYFLFVTRPRPDLEEVSDVFQ